MGRRGKFMGVPGDWDICDLPEEEYWKIVEKRLREFHETQGEGRPMFRHHHSRGHYNALPTWKPSERNKAEFLEAYR